MENNYEATCAITGKKDNLQMYPIRDNEDNMIGWVFLNKDVDRNSYYMSFNYGSIPTTTEKLSINQ